MIFEIKDIVYIAINVVSITSVIASMRGRLAYLDKDKADSARVDQLEKECKRMSRMLVDAKGSHNYVSCSDCKMYRDQVFIAIREGKSAVDQQSSKIDKLSENVLEILFILDIKKKRQKNE